MSEFTKSNLNTESHGMQTNEWRQRTEDISLGSLALTLRSALMAAALGAIILIDSSAQALDAWTTIDQYNGGGTTVGRALIELNGTLYTGTAVYPTGATNGLTSIQKSADGGTTWSLVDTYMVNASLNTIPVNFTKDTAGNLYVLMSYGTGNNIGIALRKYSSGIGTTLQVLSGYSAAGVAVDIRDNVWLAGTASSTWLTLKSVDGGTTFSLADSYAGDSSNRRKKVTGTARAMGLAAGPSGEIYVVGANNTANQTWIVRKSSNGGGAWSVVDTFQIASGYNALAMRAYVDATGTVYVAGQCIQPNYSYGTVIRKSATGGTGSFSTIQVYYYNSLAETTPSSVAINLTGEVVVTAGAAQHALVLKQNGAGGSFYLSDDYYPGTAASALGCTGTAAGRLLYTGSSGGNAFIREY
jgi:hypothetical protein